MAWIYKITDNVPWSNTKDSEEIINNTWELYNYFRTTMTKEAICGMLGNIRRESYINPGQQQIGGGGSQKSGYGLIQWTPATSLLHYVSGNWYDGNVQCDLINREGNLDPTLGGARWIPTSSYNYSWSEFCKLTSVDEATKAYLAERERAGVSALIQRLQYANECYEILQGTPPTPPTPTRRKLPLYMMIRKKRF